MTHLTRIDDILSQLKLDGIRNTLDVRLKQARESNQAHIEFLHNILLDQQQMTINRAFQRRLTNATFEYQATFENLDKGQYSDSQQLLINELELGNYIDDKRHIIIMGPTGTGKSHLGIALGHSACKKGKTVKFIRANKFFQSLYSSRADNTWENVMRKYSKPDVTIIDDFGLDKLTAEQGNDMYEFIAEKNEKSSIIVTSNRDTSEWQSLWHDSMMGNAALDRLVHNAYHIILDGESNRKKKHAHWTDGGLKCKKN